MKTYSLRPTEIAIGDLARRVIALTGSKSTLVRKPLPDEDPVRRRPDIGLAKRALDWEPATALDAGLKRTIDYFARSLTIAAERPA